MRKFSYWLCGRQSKRTIFALVLFICTCGYLLSLKSNGYNQIAAQDRVNEKNQETTSSAIFKEETIEGERKSDCSCVSQKTGRSHNFCYVDPQNATSIGLKFDCDHLPILESLNLVDNTGPFADLFDTEKNSKEVVFVSAVSDNHFTEGSRSIGEFYKFTPGRKFILYSLGLSEIYITRIKKEFKDLEVRVFNTTGYPDYVNRWMEYRFKPLILAEVMKEYSNIWWIDAHILVKKPKMIELFYEEMVEKLEKKDTEIPVPIYFFIHSSHSNYATIFPEVLTYFPSNSETLLKDEKHGAQLGANTFFVARTEYSVEIFKWWILCALDKTCMAPPGAQVYCHFKKDRFKEFAKCFRIYETVETLRISDSFKKLEKMHEDDGDEDRESQESSSPVKKYRGVEVQKVTYRPDPSPFSTFPPPSSLVPTSSRTSSERLPTVKTTTRRFTRPTSNPRTSTSHDLQDVDCNCKSLKSGKSYKFCYVDPQNKSSIGKKFDCGSLQVLGKFDLVDNPGPFVDFSDFNNHTSEIVFVSAASDNHIDQEITFLESFYKFNPTGKLIFYGLALLPLQVKKLKSKFENLEVRLFNTTGYPGYVNHWMEYRFKSLILAEVLKEYSNIWWLDANMRIEKGNMTDLFHEEIQSLVEKNGADKISPIYSFVNTGHCNFPVLFPELLTYFPSNSISLLQSEEHGVQLGANAFFISKTPYTIELFKWWVLCSLDETCMNPPGAQVSCRFSKNRNREFAQCFRFDQSVMNLLLLNDFQDHHKYFSNLGFLLSRTS